MFKRLLNLFKKEQTRNIEIPQETLDLIGETVRVDVTCYSGGLIHPEYNILMDISDTKYILKSVDPNFDDDLIWEFPIDDADCFCEINKA